MKNGIKIIFFDMDGTLFRNTMNQHGASSPWTLVAGYLGSRALQEKQVTTKRWKAGVYAGYVEWMEDNLQIYKISFPPVLSEPQRAMTGGVVFSSRELQMLGS